MLPNRLIGDRKTRRRLVLALSLCAALSACGFHLRGEAQLPFDSVYISGAAGSGFTAELTRLLHSASAVRVTDRPEDAQAVVHITGEAREKQILTLTRAGTVAEFALRYRVHFRVTGAQNRELIPASEIVLVRDYSFNDSQVLAKDQEEALLYRDMQSDAVRQVMRRLEAIKL